MKDKNPKDYSTNCMCIGYDYTPGNDYARICFYCEYYSEAQFFYYHLTNFTEDAIEKLLEQCEPFKPVSFVDVLLKMEESFCIEEYRKCAPIDDIGFDSLNKFTYCVFHKIIAKEKDEHGEDVYHEERVFFTTSLGLPRITVIETTAKKSKMEKDGWHYYKLFFCFLTETIERIFNDENVHPKNKLYVCKELLLN